MDSPHEAHRPPPAAGERCALVDLDFFPDDITDAGPKLVCQVVVEFKDVVQGVGDLTRNADLRYR
jgi:hypothetical protein